ncbi:MAG: hypothetical protein AAGJ35_09300, partial [Myxococcota bacterium]
MLFFYLGTEGIHHALGFWPNLSAPDPIAKHSPKEQTMEPKPRVPILYFLVWVALCLALPNVTSANTLTCSIGCQRDADCTASNKAKCDPKTNKCVACVEDQDCSGTQACVRNNSGVNICQDAQSGLKCSNIKCTKDAECMNALCGSHTKCVIEAGEGRCLPPPTSADCQPPNLVVVLDRSCSMGHYSGSKAVDSGFACPSADHIGNKYCAEQNPNMNHLKHKPTTDFCLQNGTPTGACAKYDYNNCLRSATFNTCLKYKTERVYKSVCTKHKSSTIKYCCGFNSSGTCTKNCSYKTYTCSKYKSKWVDESTCTQYGQQTQCEEYACKQTVYNCTKKEKRYTFPQCKKNTQGNLTCFYARWDIATNSLLKALDEYGGSKTEKYADRKIRFGLAFFESNAQSNSNLGGKVDPKYKSSSYNNA